MDRRAPSSRLPPIRNRYFFASDIILLVSAAYLSYVLRLETFDLAGYWPGFVFFAGLVLLITPLIFFRAGVYARYWRYASVEELLLLFVSVNVAVVLAGGIGLGVDRLLPGLPEDFVLPRSVPPIFLLLALAATAGPRLAVRSAAGFERRNQDNGHSLPVLVMGAGDAGAMVVREMQANPGLGFVPVGLLDDNRAKVGMMIHGVPVRGTRKDIPRLAREEQVEEVIIAMPTAPGRAIREVVALCQEAGVAFKTIPGIYELISGHVSVRQVREVRIEDLLRREPVHVDGTEAARYLSHSVVLVTGAGGSIGSELCRQIASHSPRQLLLLGHGENSIYHILRELQERSPGLAVQPFIADVRDCERLKAICTRYKPDVIFHAAAHKHVPLMETNVVEAVMNNVFGTWSLLQAAELCDIGRFVLISTDKAVNPVSMMGATKRLAELLVQDTARRTGRAYVAVRFGNVLGSRGSVVPLFQQQIAAGGPVTVTHPEMRRYFMTIPEAVQLVIQAAALGREGEIFVLDMGEQVRVVDLAAELIRLSGLEPGRDIEIVFTGPRMGEKLSEVLFADGEEPRPTRHKKILVAYGNNTWDSEALSRHLQELEVLAKEGEASCIRAKIQGIVPAYRPLTSRPRNTGDSSGGTSR